MNSLNPLNKRVVAIFFDFFLKLTLDVTHDAFSGFAGQKADIIITMEDLIDEFEGYSAYVIGVKDIMDVDFIEGELKKYFAENS